MLWPMAERLNLATKLACQRWVAESYLPQLQPMLRAWTVKSYLPQLQPMLRAVL